jgi:hypothetical protein
LPSLKGFADADAGAGTGAGAVDGEALAADAEGAAAAAGGAVACAVAGDEEETDADAAAGAVEGAAGETAADSGLSEALPLMRGSFFLHSHTRSATLARHNRKIGGSAAACVIVERLMPLSV